MFSTMVTVAIKEFKHLLRDRRFLLFLVLFPVLMLAFFGYAVNFDVKNIKLAILDLDKSVSSRKLISETTATDYFTDPVYIQSSDEIRKLLDSKEVHAVITIPKDFEDFLERNETATIQYLVDGVDANSAKIISNYLDAAINSFNGKLQKEKLSKLGMKISPPVNISPKIMYNPELKSSLFFIPGLITMILTITSVISVSLSLVKENENNTIEQIKVSPVSNLSMLLGKIFPYLIIAYINAAMILVVGYFLFGVEVQGSYFDLIYAIFIFLLAATSLGYLVSVISPSTQVAFTFGASVSMLPSLVLSDFIFQVESMPMIIQIFTNLTPAKFFNKIIRAIILRGTGFETYSSQVYYLLIFSAITILLSLAIAFRKERKT
ncbi:MAG: ABC transporter permease [Ignavibacteria bacterium]|nr:ABC transporter permease [Ignavibacteria bacterium]